MMCMYIFIDVKVCSQQAYIREWIKACALLVSIILQLLVKRATSTEQRYNITKSMAYQHSTNYAYKGKGNDMRQVGKLMGYRVYYTPCR